MMRPKRRGVFLMALGVLLILAAAAMVVNNLFEEKQAGVQSSQALEQLIAEIPAEDSAEIGAPQYEYDGSTGDLLNMEDIEIPDYVLNPEMDMPEISINGRDYIGILDIPELELSLPVITRWSYPALEVAPCRYAGSAYTDDLILAAHNYSSHFGNLKNLSEGSLIYFTDTDGNVFRYEVVLIETLLPTDTEELKSEEWDLSLFTCTPGGQYRSTVRCMRLENDFIK